MGMKAANHGSLTKLAFWCLIGQLMELYMDNKEEVTSQLQSRDGEVRL